MIHQSRYPDVSYPNVSFSTLLLDRMKARPNQVAMIDAATDRRVTFGQIVDEANRLASGLARRTFGPGQVFAVLLPNVIEYAAILLGVSQTGGTSTTLNPLATADDLAAQLGDAKARFLVTIPALLERALDGAKRAGVEEVFVLGTAPGATPVASLFDPNPIAVDVAIDPKTAIAVLPWSSGTSGRPKAVVLTHESIVAQLHQFMAVQHHVPGESVVAVLPFFHIYGLTLILLSNLWNGGCLVVMARFELEPFLAVLAKYRIVLAPVVPPIIVALTKHPLVDQYDLSALKYLMSGAAPLGGDVEIACSRRLKCLVIQGYGMTELSGASHLHPLDAGAVRHGSVGFLVPNLEARIVDPATGHDQHVGGRGELLLRGPNVMVGYLNRPAETAATLDQDRWLHTGDIGYVDAKGYYYIVDRLKELIKYKAHQVAPADLEAVLLTHPSIADAAVIPSPDPEAGEVPKAFVVLKAPLTPEEIMEYVAARVSPLDKVRRVEIVESIPKSPSGKILRRILVEQERAKMAAQ